VRGSEIRRDNLPGAAVDRILYSLDETRFYQCIDHIRDDGAIDSEVVGETELSR
jgi:hypothetical protein